MDCTVLPVNRNRSWPRTQRPGPVQFCLNARAKSRQSWFYPKRISLLFCLRVWLRFLTLSVESTLVHEVLIRSFHFKMYTTKVWWVQTHEVRYSLNAFSLLVITKSESQTFSPKAQWARKEEASLCPAHTVPGLIPAFLPPPPIWDCSITCSCVHRNVMWTCFPTEDHFPLFKATRHVFAALTQHFQVLAWGLDFQK